MAFSQPKPSSCAKYHEHRDINFVISSSHNPKKTWFNDYLILCRMTTVWFRFQFFHNPGGLTWEFRKQPPTCIIEAPLMRSARILNDFVFQIFNLFSKISVENKTFMVRRNIFSDVKRIVNCKTPNRQLDIKFFILSLCYWLICDVKTVCFLLSLCSF